LCGGKTIGAQAVAWTLHRQAPPFLARPARLHPPGLTCYNRLCLERRWIMFLLIDNYDSFTYNLWHYLGELGGEVLV
jgi:hypothetical protein